MHKTLNYINRSGMTACVSEKSISCFPFVSISLFARFISANLFLFRFGALPLLLFWVGTVNASPIVCWSSVPRLLIFYFKHCDLTASCRRRSCEVRRGCEMLRCQRACFFLSTLLSLLLYAVFLFCLQIHAPFSSVQEVYACECIFLWVPQMF